MVKAHIEGGDVTGRIRAVLAAAGVPHLQRVTMEAIEDVLR